VRSLYFTFRHLTPAATNASELARGGKTGPCPFDNQFALHLSEASHDVKEEPPRWRPGIDAIGEASEMDVAGFECIDQIHEPFHASPQPI
jgi:hypothetical protein